MNRRSEFVSLSYFLLGSIISILIRSSCIYTPYVCEMDACSPQGYLHFCLAVSISILIAETIESVVDLFPGKQINFLVYNAWGILVLNSSVLFGKRLTSKKNYWFLNGFPVFLSKNQKNGHFLFTKGLLKSIFN